MEKTTRISKMNTGRKRSRSYAVQVLFSREFAAPDDPLALERYFETFDWDPRCVRYTRELVTTVETHRTELDQAIAGSAFNWKLSRMNRIDVVILRLAIGEVRVLKTVSARVAISEAIRLCLEFSTDEARPFINGILDAVLADQVEPGPESEVPT